MSDSPIKDYLTHDPFTGEKYSGVRANIARFLSQRTDWKGKHVIDLSCGDGVTTYILRKLGATVSAYELEPEYSKLDEKPLYADVTKPLPIQSESADMVIFQEVIEHIPNHLFALQEISRILKPGGELFLTTPSRSSLQARLAYLSFESEHLRSTPWGSVDGLWGTNDKGENYYGHLWLIGIQQLYALARVAGFKRMVVHRTELGKTSLFFAPIVFPFIYLASLRALIRDLRYDRGPGYKEEKKEQFRLNTSFNTLFSKYAFASLYK